jgi:hypothetical protein
MGLLRIAVVAALLAKKHSPRPPVVVSGSSTSGDAGIGNVLPFVVFLAVVLLAGVIAYLNYQGKQRRTSGFMQMAAQLGLTYSAFDSFGLLGYPFALFQRGDGRGIENVVFGPWQELQVIAFDYWYYEESSDGKTTSKTYHRFDCVLVPIEADCVRLQIAPETFFSKLASALSFRDRQFESEAFNDAFKVACDDAKFSNDFIDARMMQWLLAHGRGYGFEVVANRGLVAGPRIEPSELPELLGVGRGFVQHVPKVVSSLYPG